MLQRGAYFGNNLGSRSLRTPSLFGANFSSRETAKLWKNRGFSAIRAGPTPSCVASVLYNTYAVKHLGAQRTVGSEITKLPLIALYLNSLFFWFDFSCVICSGLLCFSSVFFRSFLLFVGNESGAIRLGPFKAKEWLQTCGVKIKKMSQNLEVQIVWRSALGAFYTETVL